MQHSPDIHSSMNCRLLPMPVCWAASMPTAAMHRMAGIPISFPINLNELIESMLIILEAGGFGRRWRQLRCKDKEKFY